MFQNNSAAELY